ncbi:MAG: hypothetical protein Q3M30_19200 [Candidatus Electrothrix sp. Rat3]|nr:hypothetical protein [Candidatus Electrothrix rattekaaiensis]
MIKAVLPLKRGEVPVQRGAVLLLRGSCTVKNVSPAADKAGALSFSLLLPSVKTLGYWLAVPPGRFYRPGGAE